MDEFEGASDKQLGGENEPTPPSSTPWGAIRATATVLFLCGALIGGVKIRSNLDQRGITMPARTLNGAVTQNSVTPLHIPLSIYYERVAEMLKDKYVDQVTDDNALALGAVKGMVRSLNDSNSYYYSPALATAYLDRQKGVFSGIGVDLETRVSASNSIIDASALHPTSDVQVGKFPDLIIDVIAPGSSADLSGLKIGDQIDSIDGHWVVNQAPLVKLEGLAKQARNSKTAADQFNKLLVQIREQSENSMTPDRAMELLETGQTGSVKVGVLRNGSVLVKEVKLGHTSGLVSGPVVAQGSDHVIRLRFAPGAVAFLKSQLNGTPLTIDLRNQVNGNFNEMERCLSLLSPSGNFGTVFNAKTKESHPFAVKGTSQKLKVKLLVDSTTRGAAACFALALKSAGVATLEGSIGDPQPSIVDFSTLPTGAGYTLATGQYRPMNQGGKSRMD